MCVVSVRSFFIPHTLSLSCVVAVSCDAISPVSLSGVECGVCCAFIAQLHFLHPLVRLFCSLLCVPHAPGLRFSCLFVLCVLTPLPWFEQLVSNQASLQSNTSSGKKCD